MSPVLQNVTMNGASRHRMRKGFLLVRQDGGMIENQRRDQVINTARQNMHLDRPALAEFMFEASSADPNVVEITTPFHPVYTVNQRNVYIQKIAHATLYLQQAAQDAHCQLVASGVNPFPPTNDDRQTPGFCADVHQIEVFDEGEMERIYNLFRQFLPEILAISANSPIYRGSLKNIASYRMRENPQSFLPYYLSEFATTQIDRLKRIMRKDHALADLKLMDVNPLSGEELLAKQPILRESAAAIELRFVDAQCSYSFVRAQIILFQAIAIYGRDLARQGRRLFTIKDQVIDLNKALAYKDGASAMLQPDESVKTRHVDKHKEYYFYDENISERAAAVLLIDIEGCLLTALRNLDCQPWELFPILLGAELRRKEKSCIANYAELQQFLYHTQQNRFASAFQHITREALSSPTLDIISDYNRQNNGELSKDFELKWLDKLSSSTSAVSAQKRG
ncbi:MAG TPA: glutamate-cysteine ligase family protein [Ktedonobacteraceae bacterium]